MDLYGWVVADKPDEKAWQGARHVTAFKEAANSLRSSVRKAPISAITC
jgi:hypothetical protein